MLRSLGVAAIIFCFVTPTAVRADPRPEPSPARIRQAAEAFDLGREAYQREDFVEAAEQFERADSQAPSATAIEYAMRSREKAGQLDRAATLAALAQSRHANDPNLQKLSSDLLSRAKQGLFALTVHCQEPCELALESTIVHGAPSFSRVVFLKDGALTVHAGFPNGTSATRSITAVAGAEGDLSFSVPATTPGPAAPAALPPSAAPPSPPSRAATLTPASSEPWRGFSPAVFWVGVGLTVAAAGVTTWSGLDTLNDPGEERIRRDCSQGDTSCELYQLGLSKQRRTNVLLGVTGGLGLGTILVGAVFTDWRGAPARTSGKLEPWLVIGEGALAGARGRF